MTLKDRHYALLKEVARVLREGGYSTTAIASVLDVANGTRKR